MSTNTVYTLVPRSNGQVAVLDARTGTLKRAINYHGSLISIQVSGSMGTLMIQEKIGLHGHVYDLTNGSLKSRFQVR
jgi:outer membrane protein assembly factor BamB